jgi:hypothetical protein
MNEISKVVGAQVPNRPQKWRESRATIPPAELNKMTQVELQRIAKQKEVEALEPVN